jgi:hypothetical protein
MVASLRKGGAIWRLFSAVLLIAVMASVVGVGVVSQPAQAALATNPALPPKVMALALPVAAVDTAFPVLVLVKNTYSSTIDKPVISIVLPTDNSCTLVLPEEAEIKAYFGIPPLGYSFAMWFVECKVKGDITITVNLVGHIGGGVVTGSDSVAITVYDM